MSQITRHCLGNGVHLTHAPAGQFKTSLLSLSLLTPLSEDTAALHALLCPVLKRGCASYPTMQAISQRLDALYGGEVHAPVRRIGEAHCFGLLAKVTGDRFTPDGSAVAAATLELLFDLLLHPVTKNGVFSPAFVDSEKENLKDRIRSEFNDKRSYAGRQLTSAMFKNEPYGVNSLGEVEAVDAITAESLYWRYETLLQSAQIEIFYSGSAPLESLLPATQIYAEKLPCRNPVPLPAPILAAAPAEANMVTERLDVIQGKLGLGFRTEHNDSTAMMLLNGMFGGSVTSKLFMHVREELSLCYYASSQYDRRKQVILAHSGIEFENFEQARDAILAQLILLQNGDFSAAELEGARAALIGALRSYADNQHSLENYWLGQALDGSDRTPEQLAQALEAVTAEQVIAAAKAVRLDTIYFLNGKAV